MWPDAHRTSELLAAAKTGDRAAVDELLDRHRAALRRLVEARLDPAIRRRVDASDIVQDVLVEASRRLQDYLNDPAMPFHLWLRHMAQDQMIDAHRRHRGAQRRSLDREQPLAAPGNVDHSTMELAGQLCDREMTPAAAATWQETLRRFQAAVDALDDDDRQVVLMRHFEKLSNHEVAQVLNLTGPAASMRYLRAMRRLRVFLGESPSQTE
ncbi:MAG: sigma-70 family RNA polymerase sigma factor [Planctomycetia bacterium]|nr:sigma-70 family RNA polymerase sigma factor [Planctomycetia bacterium]